MSMTESAPTPKATYRFLNSAHTLVLRDDHVIAWDARDKKPLDAQPDGHAGELKIWEDAGSPAPREEPEPEDPGLPPADFSDLWQGKLTQIPEPIRPEDDPVASELAELMKIDQALQSIDDLAALRNQVKVLNWVVYRILKERPK